MNTITECDRQLESLRKELQEASRNGVERWPEARWQVLEKINRALDRRLEIKRLRLEQVEE